MIEKEEHLLPTTSDGRIAGTEFPASTYVYLEE
jgi:hypothetical protein